MNILLTVKYIMTNDIFLFVTGLHLRTTEESRMTGEGVGAEATLHQLHRHRYDPEYSRMEAWLDEHPDFAQDYFLRYYQH